MRDRELSRAGKKRCEKKNWPESVFQGYRALALRKSLARICVSSLTRSGYPKAIGSNLCFKFYRALSSFVALWVSENLWPESVFQVYRALALRKLLARICVSSLSVYRALALRKPLARIGVPSLSVYRALALRNLWPESVFQVYRALALRKPLARICVSSFIALCLSENLWPESVFQVLSRSGSPKTFGPNLCFKFYRALALRKPLARICVSSFIALWRSGSPRAFGPNLCFSPA